MIHLNLNLNNKKSGYVETFSYPAGEIQTRLTPAGVQAVREATDISVQLLIRNAEDIVRLWQFKDAVDGALGGKKERNEQLPRMELYLPYLPYSRADRRFVEGDCFGLGVFSKMLSCMGWDRIETFDVHSHVAVNKLWELVNISALETIKGVLMREGHEGRVVTALFPDKGAMERYQVPDQIGNNFVVVDVHQVWATKVRNPETGQLSSFSVETAGFLKDRPNEPIVVIDDICDGGRTFLGIADALDALGVKNERVLYVSHGIFSAGLDQLMSKFSRIYTKNLMGRVEHPNLIVL